MSTSKIIVLAALVPFVAFTGWVVLNGGSFSEIATAFSANPWISQVSLDLVLALSMVCVWMWNDAQRLGKNPLPWIVATLFTGSIAPLTYLLLRPDADV